MGGVLHEYGECKLMKKKLFYCAGIFFIVIFLCVAFILKDSWMFNKKLNDLFCIKQEFKEDIYDLVSCTDGNFLVRDVNGWIVNDEIIYGSKGIREYFFIDLKSKNVKEFKTLVDFDMYLKRHGIGEYDMSKEKNISHLRYGNQ